MLDITHPNAAEQAQTVEEVLDELGVADKPRIVALNKIDKLIGHERENGHGATPAGTGNIGDQLVAEMGIPADYVPVSAQAGIGLDRLLQRIENELNHNLLTVRCVYPIARAIWSLSSTARARCWAESYDETGTLIEGRLPARLREQFAPYISHNIAHRRRALSSIVMNNPHRPRLLVTAAALILLLALVALLTSDRGATRSIPLHRTLDAGAQRDRDGAAYPDTPTSTPTPAATATPPSTGTPACRRPKRRCPSKPRRPAPGCAGPRRITTSITCRTARGA